jgi:hypothetical protein
MSKLIRPRRLWYERKGEIVQLDESELFKRPEPLVILGEAGMGKTELTERLRQQDGRAGCTARCSSLGRQPFARREAGGHSGRPALWRPSTNKSTIQG